MRTLLLVSCGGALGTAARFLIGQWAIARLGTAFPWGTLLVNLIGSLLMAVVVELALRPGWLSPTSKLVLTTGLMGGFTTYSAFCWETVQALESRAYGLAFGYVAATLLGCLLACALGLALVRLVVP